MAAPRTHTDEPRWHASLAVVAILALYITLPARLTFGPDWVYLVLVLGLLIPLSIFAPMRHQETALQRGASIALIAIVNLFNLASAVALTVAILAHDQKHPLIFTNQQLLFSGAQIWATNILVFALWYWELDGGGPEPRAQAPCAMQFAQADFLFPQMLAGDRSIPCIDPRWKPLFFDYLYLAFTNALAFSPADAFPISRTGKMLMGLESIISFVTIAVVVARSVGAL